MFDKARLHGLDVMYSTGLGLKYVRTNGIEFYVPDIIFSSGLELEHLWTILSDIV